MRSPASNTMPAGTPLAWSARQGRAARAHRDRVNTQAMKDKRMMAMNPKTMPFDPKRMAYGGFKVLVEI